MITRKSVAELASMLAQKQASAKEIAEAYIGEIDRLNPTINAYITFDPEYLLAQALQSDERRAKAKPLSQWDGVPIAVKDNMSTKGLRTTCGSRILHNYIPPFDASVIQKLKDKGFCILAKANMDEFAMGSTNETSYFGPVRNPWDTERVPGGSSGGSAAAVAACMAPAALGSDTGGSIRLPSGFCGVTGIKPTYGRVSRYGIIAYASSLDQVGTIARTVEDNLSLLNVISGKDAHDSTSAETAPLREEIMKQGVQGLRIGIPEEYFEGVDPETKKVIDDNLSALASRGAILVPVSLKMKKYAVPVYYLIATAEASSNLARYDGIKYGYRAEGDLSLEELYLKSRSEGFGSEVKRRIILGTYALSSGYYDAYYLKALRLRSLIIDDFKKAFGEVDIIVTPVATSTAFKLGEKISDPLQMYMSDILTISVNLAALPGLVVPGGFDSKGLPVGMQILATHFDEEKIFQAAYAVQSDNPVTYPVL